MGRRIVKTSIVLDDESMKIVEAISLATGERNKSEIVREALKTYEKVLLIKLGNDFKEAYIQIKKLLEKPSKGLPKITDDDLKKFLE